MLFLPSAMFWPRRRGRRDHRKAPVSGDAAACCMVCQELSTAELAAAVPPAPLQLPLPCTQQLCSLHHLPACLPGTQAARQLFPARPPSTLRFTAGTPRPRAEQPPCWTAWTR